MTEHVQLDTPQTCVGVHWNVHPAAARAHFESWGFRGIASFTKAEVLNGNAARTKALDIAMRQGIKCFWRGSYDVGVGSDSAIYRFDYDEYVGDSEVHGDTPEAKAHADWSK